MEIHKNETADTSAARSSKSNLRKSNIVYLGLKRAFDFAVSLCASILLLAPLLVLVLFIRFKDGGGAFYVQRRVGQNGRLISVVKLRTMRKGADRIELMLTPEQRQRYRQEYKLEDDPRLIGWKKEGDGRRCFGGILRRLSLDELPQIIWNICIRGNMSFVGPRPILEQELRDNYGEEEREALLSVKPGLTGYWQAYARNNATYESGRRQAMELYYVRHACLKLDLQILLATIGAVVHGQGAL